MYRIYDVIKSILRGLLACLVHVNGPTNRSHFITKYHLQMYLTQQALLKFIEIFITLSGFGAYTQALPVTFYIAKIQRQIAAFNIILSFGKTIRISLLFPYSIGNYVDLCRDFEPYNYGDNFHQ